MKVLYEKHTEQLEGWVEPTNKGCYVTIQT